MMSGETLIFPLVFAFFAVIQATNQSDFIYAQENLAEGVDIFDIKVALLLPRDIDMLNPRIGYTTSAGAITVALEKIKDEGLLQGIRWSFITRFTQCSESLAAGIALDVIKRQNCSVIIGPPCSVPAVAVAVLSKAFNIPQFSWAATSIDLANHKRFPTLARVISSSLRLGRALKEILIYFSWHRMALIYHDDQSTRKCYSIAEGLRRTSANSQLMIAYSLSLDGATPKQEQMDKFLNDFPSFARVVIACFEDESDIRRFMLSAHEQKLTTKEYVYILPDYVRDKDITNLWRQRRGRLERDRRDSEAKVAFRRTLLIEMSLSEEDVLHRFKKKVIKKIKKFPFYHKSTKISEDEEDDEEDEEEEYGSLYSPFLHDAFYMYALALNKTMDDGDDINDGLKIIDAVKNTQFLGLSGRVVMDDEAGREPNFDVKGFNEEMDVVLYAQALMYKKDGKTVDLLVPEQEIWASRGGFAPVDVPICGFHGEKCQREKQSVLAIIVISVISASLFMVIFVTGVISYVRRKLVTNEMAKMLWKVNFKDLNRNRSMSRSLGSLRTMSGTSLMQSEDTQEAIARGDKNAAHWKGTLVWAKQHTTSLVLSSESDHQHMKQLRDINNENMNQFIGICLDSSHPYSLWKYCTKGSLEDIVNNENIKLDWFFKYSLLKDLVGGMDYLCDTLIKSHGRFTSSNCVIDNRWVLKITDYGLFKMKLPYKTAKERYWMAPELLRLQQNAPPQGTQAGDVYGFAIIVQEVILRDRPFGMYDCEPEEIIRRVGKLESPPFRPKVQQSMVAKDTDPAIVQLMMDCWKEDPEARPDFKIVKAAVRQMARGKSVNLMDHVMKMMEKYAGNLEQTITDRTRQLTDEMLRADLLLQKMLPPSVAEKLKTGQAVDPELYDAVTVLFSDVVGFTTIASRSTPMEIVALLNELYTLFDDVIEEFDVYKVETIGDGYMCASGLPHRNGDRHASEIADMSLQLVNKIKTFVMPHIPDEQLQLRLGCHSGPVVAGIVGTVMPRYCLFGDTVNVANRMESTGKASCVQISEQTHKYLSEIIGGYITKPRGEIIIKGKGVLFTYWLLAKSVDNIAAAETTSSGASGPAVVKKEFESGKSGKSTPGTSEQNKLSASTASENENPDEKKKIRRRKKPRKKQQVVPVEDNEGD